MVSKKRKEQEESADTFDPAMEEEIEYIDLDDEDSSKPPKKKLPGWVILPIIAVFIVIVVIASTVFKGGSSKAAVLHVSKVTTRNIKEIYNASGQIESENTKTYYSPVTAPILKCKAVVGDTVKSGDMLVSFDTANLERDNQQAQLNLQSSLNTSEAAKDKNAKAADAANAASAQAAAQVSDLENQVNELSSKVADAYATYQANLADAAPEVQDNANERENLQNQIDQLKADMQQNQNIMDKIGTGYNGRRPEYDAAKAKKEQDPNSLSDEEEALITAFDTYDQAQEKYSEDQAACDKITNDLNNIKDPDVNDAQYHDLKSQYDAANAQLKAAKSAADSAAAAPAADAGMSSADMANLDISDNLAELAALTPEELVEKGKEGMKADMNGVIASVATLQSNAATQGMALFSIASMDKVRVKIEASPDDYDKLKVGNKATITVGDYKYQGTLTKVDKIAVDNAKGNPVIGAEIHIDNPDSNLCIGATAKIKMTVAEAKDVLAVPTEVINTSSKGDFVYVIENGIVKEKPVELGTSSTTEIEVKSGLKKGDKVVNDLNVDIKKGMKATPIEKNKKDTAAVK